MDAVLVCGESPQTAEQVAALVRQHSRAPLILFRDSGATFDESPFDRVYSAPVPEFWLFDTPIPHWLLETAVLIAQIRTLRAGSEQPLPGIDCEMINANRGSMHENESPLSNGQGFFRKAQ